MFGWVAMARITVRAPKSLLIASSEPPSCSIPTPGLFDTMLHGIALHKSSALLAVAAMTHTFHGVVDWSGGQSMLAGSVAPVRRCANLFEASRIRELPLRGMILAVDHAPCRVLRFLKTFNRTTARSIAPYWLAVKEQLG